MEVTPEAVREGKFREALRGYNRDDVDEFLERVASGIAVLQERLRQATDRATRAEAQAAEAGELDESLRRTLVLAQRTADLVVEEARREAAQLIEDAQARHEALTAEISEERERLRDDTQKAIRDEVSLLLESRERLAADIDALGQYYDRQRDWLRTSLADQLRVLDEGGLDIGAPPALSDIDPLIEGTDGAGDQSGSGPSDLGEPDASIGPHDVVGTDDAEVDLRAAGEGDDDEAEMVRAGRNHNSALHADDNGGGPETSAMFLSELQRAMDAQDGVDPSDDDVLPPPDERARAFFDEDDPDGARRFGGIRRRRRRA